MNYVLAISVPQRLVHLSTVDLAIIAIYFLPFCVSVLPEALRAKRRGFFPAGREMTAWVAGLSFLSANLGSLELLGWAGLPTSTESLRTLVLDRCDSGHAVPWHRDDAVLLHF